MHRVQLSQLTENYDDSESDHLKVQIDHTFHLDRLIDTLESSQRTAPGVRVASLSDLDCRALCVVVKGLLLQDNMLLELQAPVKVCGDLHGQMFDLARIFGLCGHPSKQKYLFLGDYVDRGLSSLDVITTLFAYKLKYPENIHLLRGNHESRYINRVYGFKKEITDRFGSSKTWRSFNAAFDCLPIAAIIDNSIFCCHGGISPFFLRPECTELRITLNEIKRPVEVPPSGVMCDLLWADPLETDSLDGSSPSGWVINNRGCSFTFGFDIVEAFLDKFKLDLIVRAHQVVPDGYEFYCDGSLVTIFSASNYCGTFDNAAGVFNLEPNMKQAVSGEVSLNGGFHILPPDRSVKNQWIRSKKKDSKSKSKKKGSLNATLSSTGISAKSSNSLLI